MRQADATVIVWDERAPDLRRVLVERRRLPVHIIGDHHEPAVDQTGVDTTSELGGHMIMAYKIAR